MYRDSLFHFRDIQSCRDRYGGQITDKAYKTTNDIKSLHLRQSLEIITNESYCL